MLILGRILGIVILAFLCILSAPARASDVCVGVADDASCGLVAVSVLGSSDAAIAASGTGAASGKFAAVSGAGDASTSIWCLEWICPSVAASAAGDAYAECQVSSVCVAASVFGRADHAGLGVDVSGCEGVSALCLAAPAGTLP